MLDCEDGWTCPNEGCADTEQGRGWGVSIRTLLALRPPFAIVLAGLLALAACAGHEPLSAGTDGQLFARGLDEISDIYLEPVSSLRVALSGAARLARLDNKLAVSDSFGIGGTSALSLSYDGRDIAMFAMPADTAYQEQFAIWEIANGPGVREDSTLTKLDMITF